jgi:hypothetical protein
MFQGLSILILCSFLSITCSSYAQAVKSGRADWQARATLADALREAPFSGSLEYVGDCGTQPLPNLPQMLTPSEPKFKPALIVLREIFADSVIRVSQGEDGMIRMVDGNVPQELLNVKISEVSFKNAYDPLSAQALILASVEVRTFLKDHHVTSGLDSGRFQGELRRLYIEPQPGYPQISEDLKNVTVRQAMNRLLSTFPGFWVYQTCSSENGRRVGFDYFPNPSTWLFPK